MSASSGYQGEVIQPGQPEQIDVAYVDDTDEPKAPRAKRTAPDNALLPRRGGAAWRYRLNKAIGRPDKVPELGLEDEIEYLTAKLTYLARVFVTSKQKMLIVFANLKGGASKTTIANLVTAMISEVTNVTVGLMPGTASVGTSTTASGAGVAGRTLSLREFEREARVPGSSYHKVATRVPPSQHGVSVVSEDTEEKASAQDDFGLRNFSPIAKAMYNRCHVLGIDTGNDDIKPGNIGLEAMRNANVIIFTGTVDAHNTLLKMSSTIAIAMTDPKSKETVRHGIAVFSGVNGSKGPDDYAKYTQRLNHKGRVIGSLGFEGRLMGIPRDNYLSPRDKGEEARTSVTNLHKIARPTYLAVLRLAVATYETVLETRGFQCDFTGYTDDPDDRFDFRIVPMPSDSANSERK